MNFRDLVSIEECAEVVRNSQVTSGAFKVVNYQLEKVGGQPGYLGEYAHLVVTVDEGDRQTKDFRYFVKCLPFTDPKQRKIIQDVGIFSKEAVSYRELFSKFNQDPERVTKWRPSCWLARDDLMIMEDLKDTGYRPMPFQLEFGKAHMLKILDSMAQMHACSLDYEFNGLGGEKLEAQFGSMLFETTFMKESTWFTAGLLGIRKVALEGSKYALNTAHKNKIESEMITKMDRIYQLSEPSDRFQSVVVHRDLWFNNMMFRFDENPSAGTVNYNNPLSCVLLDFQIARYLPPAVDFLCTIYLLTRRSHRDQLYDTYVNYYHKTLGEKLSNLNLDIEAILPWDQFLESLDYYRLVGLLWSGVLLAFVNLPEGFLSNLHVDDSKAYHEFCLVSRDEVIMKFFPKDRYYRENLLDSVEETLEYMFGFK